MQERECIGPSAGRSQGKCRKQHFLRPSDFLLKMRSQIIPASDLVLKRPTNQNKTYHFEREQAKQVEKGWLLKHTTALTKTFSRSCQRPIMSAVCECESQIIQRVFRLRVGVVRTEAELRYAIGDPVIDMLCAHWGYRVSPKNLCISKPVTM